jgi:hypothetical protein
LGAVGVELSHDVHKRVVLGVARVFSRRLERPHRVRSANKQCDVDRPQEQKRKPFLRRHHRQRVQPAAGGVMDQDGTLNEEDFVVDVVVVVVEWWWWWWWW